MKVCDNGKIKLSVGNIIAIIIGLAGLGGGAITIGDRLYASKESVIIIKGKVDNINEKVNVIYDAFVEAAKHARIDTTN